MKSAFLTWFLRNETIVTSGVRSLVFKFAIFTGMLLGLPLLGIYLSGHPVNRYLEFPPKTQFVQHAPFSWVAFIGLTIGIVAACLPLAVRILSARRRYETGFESTGARAFPWWGWLGIATGSIAWVFAWTRFSWFTGLQPHTFAPLWLSYILVINGLCYRRTGQCMVLDRPGFFLWLFPVSAAFWWYFEYLNRFVQNWYYVGVQYGPWTYFWLATISFSTVLPAVLGTREWILSHTWFRIGFDGFRPIAIFRSSLLPLVMLVISSVALAGIDIWPSYLFPLVWVAPFVIIVSLQGILRERHILWDLDDGKWHAAVSASLAALVCGWFWEMWNYYSLAKWVYRVPLVDRFHIFEMPVLGYSGYLPFGLECIVIGEILERFISRANR